VIEKAGAPDPADDRTLAQRVREVTGDADIRLALDGCGGWAAHEMLECLGPQGRLLSYGSAEHMGSQEGWEAPVPHEAAREFRGLSSARFSMDGWWGGMAGRMGGIGGGERGAWELQERILCSIERLCVSGRLRLPIEEVYGIHHVREAVGRAYKGGCLGRVLLELDPNATKEPTQFANEKTADGRQGSPGAPPLAGLEHVSRAAY